MDIQTSQMYFEHRVTLSEINCSNFLDISYQRVKTVQYIVSVQSIYTVEVEFN